MRPTNTNDAHNPFQFEQRPSCRRYAERHRGDTILILGVVSLATAGIAGPVAWVMGWRDLQKMQDGRMDSGGRTRTHAGMVLGVIGTALLLCVVLCALVLLGYSLACLVWFYLVLKYGIGAHGS